MMQLRLSCNVHFYFDIFAYFVKCLKHIRKLKILGKLTLYRLFRVSIPFYLTCVHIISVRFWFLSGHLLGNICSLGWRFVIFCTLTICNISYFPFLF